MRFGFFVPQGWRLDLAGILHRILADPASNRPAAETLARMKAMLPKVNPEAAPVPKKKKK